MSSRYTWIHFTIFIVLLSWKTVWLPTYGRGDSQIIPIMKSQLSVSSPVDRGPLVLQYPISGESFILQPVKGQVQPFHGASRPVEVHVKTARYVHESWPFSFLRCVWTGIWRSYGFQMGIEMCPVFIQGNTLWIAHSVSFQKGLIHGCWGPFGYLDLSSSQR